MTERVALIVEYSGRGFHGWQRQKSGISTVQEALEAALSRIAAEEVRVVCAGRTDTGVHATKQTVHFDTQAIRPRQAWINGVNAYLPDGIAVQFATQVPTQFHARYSAMWRRYRYLIFNAPVRSGLLPGLVTRESRPLAENNMNMAAKSLLGEQDFTSVRAARCQSATPWRTVTHANVTRRGDLVVIDLIANAFLLHMVRNIAGVLIDVGVGIRAASWLRELLDLRNRELASVTAAPDGLYLIDVGYPPEFGLPLGPHLPHLLRSAV